MNQLIDTTIVTAVRIVSNKDTITLQVDKTLLNSYKKDNKPDTIQILAIILPIAAALLTLLITRLFDNIIENKKNKNDILKKNREDKFSILQSLNELKASLTDIPFREPDLEDYYEWTADRMIGVNPFHNLFISYNILFNKEIEELSQSLYYYAEEIKRTFNKKDQTHPSDNLKTASKIIDDLNSIITLISKDLKT